MDDEKLPSKSKSRAQTFRACVGAIILGKKGKVLSFERKDIPGAWQFPQGGLDKNESPLEAVEREVREETGIQTSDLKLLATAPRLLAYELPEEARTKKLGRGQVQYWFLFRFTGEEDSITLGDQKEFKAWNWMSMKKLLKKVVSFKQPVYQELAKDFKSFLK
jgi:putative (di)nucleoside polyphosphate hydrolase